MTEPLSTEIQIIAQASDHTQSALLITVVQTAKAIGFFDTLLNGLDVKMKQVVYSHRNKLETLVTSIAVGSQHISQIQTLLVPDTAAAGLFGMARFPDQAQINAFLHAMGPEQVAHLEQAHQQLLLHYSRAADQTAWVALPSGLRLLPVDIDQTYLVTRSTQAEGAVRGYFGRKRGQRGYKKSLAFLGGGVREVLWQRLEPGNGARASCRRPAAGGAGGAAGGPGGGSARSPAAGTPDAAPSPELSAAAVAGLRGC